MIGFSKASRSQATFYYYAGQILRAAPLDEDHPLS